MAFTERQRFGPIISLLDTSQVNIDADQDVLFPLPAGFGDCVILEVHIRVHTIATLLASSELHGPWVFVAQNPNSDFRDFLGASRWTRIQSNEVYAQVRNDAPVLWKMDEALRIRFEEIDTNVAPTADLEVYAQVQKVDPNA